MKILHPCFTYLTISVPSDRRSGKSVDRKSSDSDYSGSGSRRWTFLDATSELKFSMAIICQCHNETKFSWLISIFSGPHTIVDSPPHDIRLYLADQTSNSFQSHMWWPADCVITVDTWYIVMQLSLGPWLAVQKHSLWQDRLWNQAA